MTKHLDADLDRALDAYEHRDQRRQQEIDDRQRAERDFYSGFQKLVTDVIRPEMERLVAKLTSRGHRCSIAQELASATNEGYDHPGSIRFVFIPDQRYSEGRDDPAAIFSAGSDRTVEVAYSGAVPAIADPDAQPRNVALAQVTRDLVAGQVVAMVKAFL